MRDPTSTQRRSSRPTSTRPPTIPRRSANTTTSPIPPLRRAGPTTTATTAETRPTTGSPNPSCRCPKWTPPHRHGDITEPTWTEIFLRARPVFLCSPPPLSSLHSSLPHGRVCVFRGISGTFHQEVRVWRKRPVSRCARGQLGDVLM